MCAVLKGTRYADTIFDLAWSQCTAASASKPVCSNLPARSRYARRVPEQKEVEEEEEELEKKCIHLRRRSS